jgi:Protein of unknown function (DUF2958)
MKLLTKDLLNKLPALYSTEKVPTDEKVLVVKYFCSWSNWTWFGAEFDPEDRIFFGYVEGFEHEWGEFSLDELESITGPMGLKIERDLYFKPTKFKELK